jgi:flagellar biosynthetic protein FlhB
MAAKGTEEPTPKRKREARRDGRIAKSGEIGAWGSVLAFTMILPWGFSRASSGVMDTMNQVSVVAANPTNDAVRKAWGAALMASFSSVVAISGVIALIVFVSTIAQVGFLVTGKPLKPSFKRLNPASNIKSILGTRGLWETAKQAIRAAILLTIGWKALRTLLDQMVFTAGQDIHSSLAESGSSIMSFVRTAALASFALALGDYGVQKAMLRRELRMTRQEIRDEFRQSEGDPMVKSRIRQLQRERARQRMMDDVPSAAVIIVNPTHYSVALKWQPGMSAPIVVASGLDRVAAQIKAKAQENGVPIVEAPPLARALHKHCHVGEPIPPSLFEAVARVLAAIARIRNTMGAPISLDVAIPDEIEQRKRKRRSNR